MKKLFSLFLIFSILLCGCNPNNKRETIVCNGSVDGLIQTENTLEYSGDNVLNQTVVNSVSLDALGMDKTGLETVVKDYSSSYNIEGVTYSYTISEEGVFSETIIIDYQKVNYNELASSGLIDSVEGKTISYISLESTKKSLETYNFVCE